MCFEVLGLGLVLIQRLPESLLAAGMVLFHSDKNDLQGRAFQDRTYIYLYLIFINYSLLLYIIIIVQLFLCYCIILLLLLLLL